MTITLGSNYNDQTNELYFGVFSKNASHIRLYFYSSPRGTDEFLTKILVWNDNNVWNITLSLNELKNAGLTSDYIYYGYRAWGPNWEYNDDWQKGSDKGFISDVDNMSNRFNPNKLLIDPYARELSHDPAVEKLYVDPIIYSNDYYGGNNRTIDTGKAGPKSILTLGKSQTDYGIKPKRLLLDDVIYEVNLRGFTMLDASIPPKERGTFKGAAQKAGYLKELGVTAVEFLPVHEFADEQNDDNDPRGDNYWGYMTLNYFSPNRRYSADKNPGGPTREFKEMVKTFHAEGIKVFLDVVYNHTGEGLLLRKVNQGNPVSREDIEKTIQAANLSRNDDNLQDYNAACILNFAGLDNQSYYFLRDEDKRYESYGSCGPNLNYDHDVVKNLIIDSLKYWAYEMGVDGFRFDLAPILSMTKINGTHPDTVNTKIFEDISNALPSRPLNPDHGVDLIAEPWGYEDSNIDWSSHFPWDWALWNKHFRDTLKTSMNKYGVIPLPISDISKVLSGSKEFIEKNPWNSINYYVSHDDCNSLRNIFSYNIFFHLNEAQRKDDQISWDQGGSLDSQKKTVRNAFTLLMLSAGVPMFTGGDELFRAVPPYDRGIGKMNLVSIDSPDVYVDFGKYNEMQNFINTGNKDALNNLINTSDELYTFQFVKNLIQFRNKHECLRPSGYFSGKVTSQNGLKDITWHKEDGNEINSTDWDKGDFIAYRINAQLENIQSSADKIDSIYVAYNRSPKDQYIRLPQNIDDKRWYRVLDTDNTNGWMSQQGNFDGGSTLLESEYTLHERSILVLVEK